MNVELSRISKTPDTTLKKTIISGFDVHGTIYDQSGSPVSGRTVSLYSPSANTVQALRAASGPNGKFVIKYVVAADDFRLNVNTGGSYTFDAAPYSKLEIYDGMPPLKLQLESAGLGSISIAGKPRQIPRWCGKVFSTPWFRLDVITMILFGPGVIVAENMKIASARRCSGNIGFSKSIYYDQMSDTVNFY